MPLFAALVCVDEFERLRDEFGISVLRKVIDAVGEIVVGQCRSYDLAAQYGDATFVVALDRVDRAVTVSITARFAVSISAFDWSTIASGLQVRATVVAANLARGTTLETQLGQLEDRAKAGRTNCGVWSPASAVQN